MNLDKKILAALGLYISLIAAIVALGLFLVQQQFNLYVQITLGVMVIAFSLAVFINPRKTRELLSGRQARNTSNALLMTIAVVGILTVINYLGFTNTRRWDLTEDRQNSLSTESIAILESLPSPVNVTGFFSPLFPKDEVTRLLETYKASSNGKFDYSFIDPDANPAAAQQAQITRDGTLVFSMQGRSEQITFADEEEFSGALLRLANPGERVVHFLTGHGEYELDGSQENKYSLAKTALVAKNYTVQTLNLLTNPKIPVNSLAIVIPGGKISINSQEVEILKDYLESGKAVVWLKNPSIESGIKDADDQFAAYLQSDWGITLDDTFVIDLNINPPTVTVADFYGNHPITNKLQGLVTIFPGTRSISYDPNSSTVAGFSLISTSQAAWAETDLESIANQTVSVDERTDKMGPVDVAVAAINNETNGRLVIVGDSEFASDNNFTEYGNGSFLINAIDWAAGQENLINLTPRNNTQRVLIPPTVLTNGIILLISVFIIPGLVLMAGIASWIQRKKRG